MHSQCPSLDPFLTWTVVDMVKFLMEMKNESDQLERSPVPFTQSLIYLDGGRCGEGLDRDGDGVGGGGGEGGGVSLGPLAVGPDCLVLPAGNVSI